MNGNQGSLMFDGAPTVNLTIGINAKKCAKCGQKKHIDEFYVDNQKRDKHDPRCKACSKIDRHKDYLKNPDKVNSYAREWRERNMERVKEAAKEWVKNNKNRVSAISKEWRTRHPEKQKRICASWVERNPERRREIKNRGRRKLRSTIKGCLSHRISTLMLRSLKENKNGRPWEQLVGYNCEQLKNHLEKKFLPGMSWENMGEWHIDHKIPVSAFNYERPEDPDFKKCWTLSNLQPLWAMDNFIKNAALAKPFQPSLAL